MLFRSLRYSRHPGDMRVFRRVRGAEADTTPAHAAHAAQEFRINGFVLGNSFRGGPENRYGLELPEKDIYF